ncbi:DUF2625 domain-containing protein [Flavobacterium aquidurense]|uniref:DUF2625 domain containing protein n=1 Tax=Flavobacterium aquidurense TaxID=362413 RepID=A0A0Q0WU09_9FLAO|nr:DUF2625 domain-containing protein [Flavobacterium aquidurense]KQB39563.1 DUF2625 domain containing protein [Flavobacterium aquidurense]
MKVRFPLIVLTFITFAATAQTKMKEAEELIDKADPGWTIVEDWIKTAKNKVEVLPVDALKAKDALYKTQVTTRSSMGAIVFMTGGLLIDDGWIRILGSGNLKFNRTLPDWNKGKSFKEFGETPPFLLIADDAIGGFYLLNGGGLGTDVGKVYYFSPDNLEYEQLDITYSEFLGFCFNNDLDKFYEGNRWNGWRQEVSKLKGDEVFNFYPFLWSAEGSDINKSSRKIIPVQEQYNLNLDLRKQLGFDQ